jgi:hypothetical protein
MARKFVEFDPAVTAILGDSRERQETRGMSRAQRKERARQAARVRVTLDVPDWLKNRLMDAAEGEACSASSLAAWLLMDGLRRLRSREIDPPKLPSGSPRFEWLVDVPEDEPAF